MQRFSSIFIVIYFVMTQSSAQSLKNLNIIHKGSTTIIKSEESTYQAAPDLQFKLNETNKTILASTLRKGIDWGQINSSKKLSFKKLIQTVDRDKVSKFRPENVHFGEYKRMSVVFNGLPHGGYTISLYVTFDTVDKFDIDYPGRLLWTLTSEEQIQELINLLLEKPTNLDEIFK